MRGDTLLAELTEPVMRSPGEWRVYEESPPAAF
jgi:hypothetical protein